MPPLAPAFLSPLRFALILTGVCGASHFALAASTPAKPAPPPAKPAAAPAPAPVVAPEPEPEAEPPPAATDATARKILENMITVTGGADALRKVAMIQFSGTETPLGKGNPIQFTYWIAPPNHARLDTAEPLSARQTKELRVVLDGKQGWTTEPTAKNPAINEASGAQLADLVRLAAFVTPFLDYDALKLRYQYAGKEKFRGTEALVVKYWSGQGQPDFLYFNPENFLLMRVKRDVKVGASHAWMNLYVTSYAKTSGFWLPTTWEYALGDTVYARVETKEIKILPQADASLFTRPVSNERVLRSATPAATAPNPAAPSPPAR